MLQALLVSANRHAIAAVALLLAGCGGGGGGGGDSGNPPPPPPPPPITENDLVVVTSATGDGLASSALAAAESLLQLGSSAARWFWDIRAAIAEGENRIDEACGGGGSRDIQWQDLDSDESLSPGDRVTVDIDQCFVRSLNHDATGALIIDFVSVPPTANARQHGAVLHVQFDDLRIEFDAAIAISVNDEFGLTLLEHADEDIYTVDGGAEFQLNYHNGSATERERYLGFTASKRVDYVAARYEIALAGEVRSQLIPGRFTVTTPAPIGGPYEIFPDAGAIEISGANGTRARLESTSLADNRQPQLRLDSGSGSFGSATPSNAWDNMLEGFIWWEPAESLAFPVGYPGDPLSNVGFRWHFWRLETAEGLTRPRGPNFLREVPLTVALHQYFSGDVAPASVGPFEFDYAGSLLRPFTGDIAGDVEIVGAMITVSPSSQLVHGAEYAIDPPSDLVLPLNGGGAALIAASANINTRNDLNARATRNPPVAVSGATVVLNASSSLSDAGPVASYTWEQLSGPAVTLSQTDEAITSFTAPAVSGTQEAIFKLTITDATGVFDAAPVAVAILPTAPDGLIFAQYIDALVDNQVRRLVTTADAAFQTLADPAGGQLELAAPPPPTLRWTLRIDPLGSERPTVGHYDDVLAFPTLPTRNLFHFQSPDGDCVGQNHPMTFDIFEVEYTDLPFPQPAVSHLAIDFAGPCGGSAIERGAIRLNSTLPLPAM